MTVFKNPADRAAYKSEAISIGKRLCAECRRIGNDLSSLDYLAPATGKDVPLTSHLEREPQFVRHLDAVWWHRAAGLGVDIGFVLGGSTK